MNLHRTSGKPDWADIPASKRTPIQTIAAATMGLLTPGNVITVIGLGLVIYGLTLIVNEQYWTGIIMLAVGRFLDIVDGVAADKTGTKSPTGEIFDAASDKIGTILLIVVLFLAQITSWWIIVALVIPQIIIPIVSFYKRQKGIAVHPTLAGKLSMGLTWVAILGLLILKALGIPLYLAIGIYTVIGISLVLGLYALWQYSTGRD